MKPFIALLVLASLAACSPSNKGAAPAGPSGATTSGRPSGANGTPSGAAQT